MTSIYAFFALQHFWNCFWYPTLVPWCITCKSVAGPIHNAALAKLVKLSWFFLPFLRLNIYIGYRVFSTCAVVYMAHIIAFTDVAYFRFESSIKTLSFAKWSPLLWPHLSQRKYDYNFIKVNTNFINVTLVNAKVK